MEERNKRADKVEKLEAVARWIRDMPDKQHAVSADHGNESKTISNSKHESGVIADNFSNLQIDIERINKEMDGCSEGLRCEVSGTNILPADSTLCKGSQGKGKVKESTRRVKFDINIPQDDLLEDAKIEQNLCKATERTRKEDTKMLRENMAKFLQECKTRKCQTSSKKVSKRASLYIVDCSERADVDSAGFFTPVIDERSKKQKENPYTLDQHKTESSSLQDTPSTSAGTSRGGGWNAKQGWIRSKRKANQRRKFSMGALQAPVISGLVVDTVDNQKPSIVRASKNANIREEFALKQKVEGYRVDCAQNISRINHVQRKLSTNLLNLKRKMAASALARAQAEGVVSPERERARTEADELFLHSKGYIPDVRSCGIYSFPPLSYPKRRVLTVNQVV